ncbi:hypothetical protein QUB80_06555 [Chlorogloeopsis sp. ULAP01]|uniref:hypothetical protein n=1 Tax=Chlorogloeopsis sp. ULAP01 TaxID=3056483 RepID=UPI0025AAC23C|nr:hypothetical protein [Chlorogloeopsis sp. ULAP01]MDM9380362.1 hypothetical protein [Chlorogloeopsis sp. ULAP01]
MLSSNLLAIFNPSNYWRSGHVTISWQPIYQQFQIPPEELILNHVKDSSATPLLAQIDRVDPEDSSRDTLVFSLPEPISPGAEDYSITSAVIKVERGKPISQESSEPSLEIVYGSDGRERGVRLMNSRLIIWFNLVPAPENDGRNWFAGSATSVQLEHQEILDQFQAAMGEWINQDPEKRCMQIDELQLTGLCDSTPPHYSVSVYDRSYRLVSHSCGPVRASITIASEPFDYSDIDPRTGKERHLSCELYRVLSLYAGADYVIEELFVKGKSKGQSGTDAATEAINLDFAARYYAYMDMSQEPQIYQNPNVPDWFAVGSSFEPYAGYGFATDVHVDSIGYSHDVNDKRFTWQLLPGKSAKSLHLFMRCPQKDFDSQAGQYWYELIYKPLKAEIYQESQRQFSESQKKLTDIWNEFQKQLSESQKKLAYTWVNSLSTDGIIQEKIVETVQKNLNFQKELINTTLKAQETTARLGIETQKQFWDNYFKLMQKSGQ